VPSTENFPENRWAIALAVSLGTLLGTIDASIMNVVLPHLRGSLSASIEEVSWVTTGYLVAAVIIMPLTAWLGARFGRRRLYLTSLLVFIAASALCGVATSLAQLVAFRVLQGIGAGALLPTEQAILRESFPESEQGRAMALYSFVMVLGPTLGPTLGGHLVDEFGWPFIFYINVPIGLCAWWLASRWVRKDVPSQRTPRIDWAGLGLLIVGVGACQILLEQGERSDWFESTDNLILGALAAVAFVLFIAHELDTESPIVNLRVLTNRSLAVGTLIGALFSAALFANVFLLGLFLQEILGYSPLDAGLAILPRALTTLIAIPAVGAFYQRVSPRALLAFGLGLAGLTCVQMSRFTLDTGPWEILVPQVLQGIALACIMVPLFARVLATVERERVADAAGVSHLFRQLGASFGIAALASVLGRFAQQASGAVRTHLADGGAALADRLALFAHAGAGKQQALAMLDRQVETQVSVLGFERTFFVCGLLFFAAVPLAALLESTPATSEDHAPMMEAA
jgi:DHA2 family multidrug resistance protein